MVWAVNTVLSLCQNSQSGVRRSKSEDSNFWEKCVYVSLDRKKQNKTASPNHFKHSKCHNLKRRGLSNSAKKAFCSCLNCPQWPSYFWRNIELFGRGMKGVDQNNNKTAWRREKKKKKTWKPNLNIFCIVMDNWLCFIARWADSILLLVIVGTQSTSMTRIPPL